MGLFWRALLAFLALPGMVGFVGPWLMRPRNAGRGTLAPWALGFHSRWLWCYAAILAVEFNVRVVFFEEPWLARTHGTEFAEYRARVPRWFF
jgi:protein-S-isoprenylcysteine O-methyltransferase Ste14